MSFFTELKEFFFAFAALLRPLRETIKISRKCADYLFYSASPARQFNLPQSCVSFFTEFKEFFFAFAALLRPLRETIKISRKCADYKCNPRQS